MESENIVDVVNTSETTEDTHDCSKENSQSKDSNYEERSKAELILSIKKLKNHCTTLEIANQSLNKSVTTLEQSLNEQYERCKALEEDKSLLKNNIKKASANWFERKSRLSESDSESNYNDGSHSSITSTKYSMVVLDSDQSKELSHCACSDLRFKQEELNLINRRYDELSKRMKKYENVINDQEVVIQGLEKQLDTYFTDNKLMCKQLSALHKLFGDLETVNDKQVKIQESQQSTQSSFDSIPTAEDFKIMSGSIAKTYMKLKELILEKKSLVTEIDRLRTLNVELQNRVSTQETKLIRVSDALQTTWLLVSNLKDEHEKIHTNETILRYELKEKREILRRLKSELECSREQWHIIRQKNSETEQEWSTLRNEINERRKMRDSADASSSFSLSSQELELMINKKDKQAVFEPPIDLLLDMGIEHGIVNAEDDEPSIAVALVSGEDVHEERLQTLEEQCCFLYQKLMTSTARALTLASHLSSIHESSSFSEDEDLEAEEEDFEEDYDGELNIYETEVASPDSESYDTAYVSETDGTESAAGVPDCQLELEPLDSNEIPNEEESSEYVDENGDVLSRRLITFLPRKMEILKAEIVKLEEKVLLQQEEKVKLETTLTTALETEQRQKKHLEDQLSHLGKCVDELKLERNGKIEEVEEKLRKKVQEIEEEERKHEELRSEYEKLSEKYHDRELILQLSSANLEEVKQNFKKKIQQMEAKISELEAEIVCPKSRLLSTLDQCIQTNFDCLG